MNIEFEKQMGRNIRHIQKGRKAHRPQELLSAKLQLAGCDITRSAVAKIEVGQRHIYPDEIRHIRQILSTTYEELFERQYTRCCRQATVRVC